MLNILKPYAVYTYIKLLGVVQIKAVIVPIVQQPDEAWIYTIGRYDPLHMANFKSEYMRELTELIQVKHCEDGWKFTGWYEANLDPAMHKPGMYEDVHCIQIGIKPNESGQKTSDNTGNQ